MTKEETFEKALTEFDSSFRNSDVLKSLKKADEELDLNKELRPLAERKKELESKISLAYLQGQDYQSIMDEYKALFKELADNPSVKKYNQAYGEVIKIKAIFDKGIFFKLL